MKNKIDATKRLLVIVFCMLMGLAASAQDIIKLKKGEELQVKVLKVTPSYIEYSYPNEDAVIQIQRKKVASIHYESGRVEEFEKPKVKESSPEAEVKEQPEIKESTPKVEVKVKIKEQPKEKEHSVRTSRIKENSGHGFFSGNPLEKKQMFYVKAGLALNKIHYYDANYSSPFLGDYRRFKTGEALDLGYSRYIKNSKFYWAAELGFTTRGCYYNTGDVYIDGYDDDLIIKDTYQYTIHHGIKMAPIIFGYRFMLPRDFAIDLRLGGYFTYYYAGKKVSYPSYIFVEDGPETTWWTYNGGNEDRYDYYVDPHFKMQRRYNAGFEAGIAFWYKRFCFDFTYNVGFVSFDREPKLLDQGEMTTEDYMEYLVGYYENPKSFDWEVRRKNYNYNIQFKLGIAF